MQEQNNKICVVILTGGLSSRMGGWIKSLEKFNNKTIFDRILERISPQTKHIIINSNDDNNNMPNPIIRIPKIIFFTVYFLK